MSPRRGRKVSSCISASGITTTLRLMIELKRVILLPRGRWSHLRAFAWRGRGRCRPMRLCVRPDLAAALFERNFLPEEAVLRPACGRHVLIPVGADKRDNLAGNGDHGWNQRNRCAYGVRDRSAKQLGGSAASDSQVGTVLLDALLAFTVHIRSPT
jgi:hypothetical protein